jgi:hypothetical protein
MHRQRGGTYPAIEEHGPSQPPTEDAAEREPLMNSRASLSGNLVSRDGGARHGLADSAAVRAGLESAGIALTPPLLNEAECQEIRSWFGDTARFRNTVVIQRYGFGRGTYRYLADPSPAWYASCASSSTRRWPASPMHGPSCSASGDSPPRTASWRQSARRQGSASPRRWFSTMVRAVPRRTHVRPAAKVYVA